MRKTPSACAERCCGVEDVCRRAGGAGLRDAATIVAPRDMYLCRCLSHLDGTRCACICSVTALRLHTAASTLAFILWIAGQPVNHHRWGRHARNIPVSVLETAQVRSSLCSLVVRLGSMGALGTVSGSSNVAQALTGNMCRACSIARTSLATPVHGSSEQLSCSTHHADPPSVRPSVSALCCPVLQAGRAGFEHTG